VVLGKPVSGQLMGEVLQKHDVTRTPVPVVRVPEQARLPGPAKYRSNAAGVTATARRCSARSRRPAWREALETSLTIVLVLLVALLVAAVIAALLG
jgi:hypothetical protein